MGLLTKQYLRYVPGSLFGVIGTGRCICFITRFNKTEIYVAVAACENVFIWDLRKKVKVLTLTCDINATVTALEPRPPLKNAMDNSHVAVGYSDGSLALFDTRIGSAIRFNGHNRGITTIAWDPQGMRVSSGSEDGEIVVWDVVSERGIVRLRGHKGRITKLNFLKTKNIIVSSGTDTFIKFWDLETNHCFCTLVKHGNEVWDFIVIKDDTRLLAGSSDGEMAVWSLKYADPLLEADKDAISSETDERHADKIFLADADEADQKIPLVDEGNYVEEENSYMEAKLIGRIVRSRKDRVCGLITDGRTIACHGKSDVIDLYIVLNEEELAARIAKRLKKENKRNREFDSEEKQKGCSEVLLSDEIRKIPPFKALNKVNGVSIFTSLNGSIKVSSLHMDNSIACYGTNVQAKLNKNKIKNLNADTMQECVELSTLCLPAHRSEIRTVSFNSIGDEVITASADSIKVWHRSDCQVVTTIECNYALSMILPPGDRHVIIGTRSGYIKLYDLRSGELLIEEKQHEANESDKETGVWALSLTHDRRGFVSGGSDCKVFFWNFELVDDTKTGKGKTLTFIQDTKCLKVPDQVTALKCSSNGKFLVVATFDLKETVYYMDTLKLVHELYGKSMPATCLDFSSDSMLIITGSKDSCLRIYATDFGDQKRLIKNAHQGGVTDVKFIAKTHLFFSCGHDGTVKQWDADNFQRIITLTGHHGIARCLSICPKGAYVVSCGQDRSIRLWERTNEPLVLEDEREEERRKKEEEEGVGAFQRPVIAGEATATAVRPSKTSVESEKAADQLLEAIAIYRNQREAGKDAVPHQLMTLVYKTEDPLKFILLVLRKIKSSELEEAVLVLPFNRVLELLVALKGILDRDWDVELATRVLVVAVRTNLPQILASQQAFPIIRALANTLPLKTQALQDIIGFNLAGLRHMQDRMEQRSELQLFVEAATKVKDRRRRRKKKERIVKRAMLSL